MTKIFFVAAFLGILALGKYLSVANPIPDVKNAGWWATIGIISSFATFLSLLYILARKLAHLRLRKKTPDFIEVLRTREKSFQENSMLPLVSLPIFHPTLPEIVIDESGSTPNPAAELPEG